MANCTAGRLGRIEARGRSLHRGRASVPVPVGVLLLVAWLLPGSGCSRTDAPVDVRGGGATFPGPLYAKWTQAFNASQKAVRTDYQATGSGAGITAIQQRTMLFGATDAPLADSELTNANGTLVHLPTVAGPVVMAYNLPALTEPLVLDAETISGIYLGQITRWNSPQIAALNPGVTLPDVAVGPCYRSDGSGTTFIFTDFLTKASPAWAAGPGRGKNVQWPSGVGGKGNDGVAAAIKQSVGAIGYVEYQYANLNKLPYALVRNQSGKAVKPSTDSVRAAIVASLPADGSINDLRLSITHAPGEGGYPISGFTYLLVYEDLTYLTNARQRQGLVDFLTWAMNDGQKLAEEAGYVPLPEQMLKAVQQRIASLKR